LKSLCKFIFGAAAILAATQASAEVIAIDQAAVRAAGGFPYTITKPGSYKLTGNLTVPVGSNGIVFQASDVSLNLNGFVITCAGGQGTGLLNVEDFTLTNLTVRNGNVSGCWQGVNFDAVVYATVEALNVSRYGTIGIQVQNGVIRKCATTGGSQANSIGMAVMAGTLDSNIALGDSFGLRIYGTFGLALVTGNVVKATISSLDGANPANYVWGNNAFSQPASDHTSQHNNLCGPDLPC
jgi:hypothetical protein